MGSVPMDKSNEDAVGTILDKKYSVLVVADGLGSFQKARESSRMVVDSVLSTRPFDADELDLKKTFTRAQKLLLSQRDEIQGSSDENIFGTTLICLVETEQKMFLAYAGNGSAWHLRGNFSCTANSDGIPWSANNLLNPHSFRHRGREVLYRLLSDDPDVERSRPSVLSIDKDPYYGDIVILTSDGVDSADQQRFGKNQKGTWLRQNEILLQLYNYIHEWLKSTSNFTPSGLEALIMDFLFQHQDSFQDHASIGILITRECISYYQREHHKK